MVELENNCQSLSLTFPLDLMPLIRQRKMIIQANNRQRTICHLKSPIPSSIPSEISKTSCLKDKKYVKIKHNTRIQWKIFKICINTVLKLSTLPMHRFNSQRLGLRLEKRVIGFHTNATGAHKEPSAEHKISLEE